MHRTLTILTALTAAVLLTGCTADPSPDPTPTSSTATPAPAPVRDTQLPPLSTESGGDFATLQSQRDAAEVATAVMTAFVTRDRPYDDWWAQLAPYLAPEAAAVWEYTDPRLVPASAITGPTTVVDAPSSTLVIVDIPTDAGTWRLDVIRFVEEGADTDIWKVFTLQPPEST